MPRSPEPIDKRDWITCPYRMDPVHRKRIVIEALNRNRAAENVLHTIIEDWVTRNPGPDIGASLLSQS